MNRTVILFLFITLSGLFSIQAQNQLKNSLNVKKTDDFEITGSGNHEFWDKTEWVQLVQRNNQSANADMKTRFKILYSDTGIYLLYDSTDEVLNASIESDFEELWYEDVVEAFFWPDQDERTYFEYELSPLNYELPILVSQKKGETIHWIPFEYSYTDGRKTRHKTTLTGGNKEYKAEISGWRGEIFIPFKLMWPLKNVSPVSGSRWKANFYRVDYDYGPTSWSWQPYDESFHDLDQYGTIVFE